MSALTEEDRALLTPEEVAAIEDPEYNAQEREALAAIAAQSGDDAGNDPLDGDDDAGSDESPAIEVADPASQAASPTPAEEAKADAQPQANTDKALPVYKATLPDDFTAKVEDLKTKEAQAWEKFDSGEFDRSSLQAELQSVEQERQSLNAQKIKAEISQEMSAQTEQVLWKSKIDSFMSNIKTEVDYAKDAAKEADLDQFVKVLAANPTNNDKTMEWFLAEGHKRVMALHGLAKATTPPQANRRDSPARGIPQTLAHVPGADGPGDVAGEFVNLESLVGHELEAAIARLTPAQRERYLRD